MGTRALTFVYDESKNPVLCLYSQWDGYPSGHGQDLAAFLDSIQLINGFTGKETGPVANGMGCLAALLVSHLKKEVGSYYIVDPGVDHGQDYEYHIYEKEVVVKDPAHIIFKGDWHQLSEFCRNVE